MLTWLAAALAGVGAPERPVLEVAPRPIAVVWVAAPLDREVDVSRLLRVGAAAIERVSPFRARSPEQAGVDPRALADCPVARRLACWTETATPREGARPTWLFVLRHEGRGVSGTRLAPSALDLTAARASLSVDSDPERREDALFDALRARPPVVLRRGAERAEVDALAEALRSLGSWSRDDAAPGELVLELEGAGRRVELDGRVVGLTGPRGARLQRVPPGRHELALWSGERLERRCRVSIPEARGATLRVDAEACPAARREEPAWVGSALGAAGLGLAAAGGAFMAAGIVALDDAPPRVCAAGGPCGGLPWAGFGGTAPVRVSADPAALRPSGVGFLPLGTGLAVAGLGAAAGGWWVDEDLRWWVALGGAVIGAAAGLGLGALGEP